MLHFDDSDLHFHHRLSAVPSQSEFDLHIHQEFEIMGILTGSGCCVIEGIKHQLRPGSIMINTVSEAHILHIDSDKPFERLVLHFRPELINSVDVGTQLTRPFTERELGYNNVCYTRDANTGMIFEFLRKMSFDYRDHTENRVNIVANLFPLLLSVREAFSMKKLVSKSDIEENKFHFILNYINSHIFDHITLETLVNETFMSKSQICRIFKERTETTVFDYIKTKRLVAARQQILNGESAIHASHSCGFGDYSSFYRAYKAKFSVPPSDTDTIIKTDNWR